MIYYIAGLSLSRIPSLAACHLSLMHRRGVCETQISKNTQEYRSGHNEAVLKTVCPKGTGVRIPLPAPKNKDTPCGCPLFFATVRGSRIRSPSELARRGVRI